MMRPREVKKAARAARVAGLAIAVFGAIAGLIIGRVAGTALARGYQVDWYVEPAHAFLDLDAFAGYALAVTAIVAFGFAALGIGAASFAWDKMAKGNTVRYTGTPTNRDTFTLGATAGLALMLPLLIAVGGVGLLFLAGSRGIENSALAALLGAAGAAAGFFAAWLGSRYATAGLARGRLVKTPPGDNLIGKIAIASGKHNKATLLFILIFTGVMATGIANVHTNVDVADVLPRGDPNTAAAQNVTERFKSTFTQQVTFQLPLAPHELWLHDNERLTNRVTEPDPTNISDEVYVRAIAELTTFVKEHSIFEGSVGIPDFYQLINWTLAGGESADDSAFRLPATDVPGSLRYQLVHETTWAAIPGTVDAVISPSYRQTALLFTVDPKETMSSKEIGKAALEVRDAYVRWAETTPAAYKVFTGENAPLFSVDLPIANAHSSELATHDFTRLMPAISLFILVALFIGFRSAGAITVAFSALAVAVTITFGAMGHMNIPLNTLNLTTVALIMGVGIDYGIHIINEYLESRARGLTQEEAFQNAGGHSAFALLVATLTTVSGLAILMVSPSILIAQLGLLSIIAMIASFSLTITFIPAGLAFLKTAKAGAQEYRPSNFMGGVAKLIGGNRFITSIVLLALLAGALYSSERIGTEAFGDPPRNWLDDDPLRQEHEAALKGFYDTETDDVKANILIFQGSAVTDPATHAYMRGIECSLKTKPRVISDTLRTLPFLIDTYLTVKDGPASVPYIGTQRSANPCTENPPGYPETQEELTATINHVFTTPLFNFANLFIDNPENEIAIMTFSAKADTYESAKEVWDQVQAAIQENEANRPASLQVNFFGNTAINYLFVAKEVPWLTYMAVATNIMVVLLVLLFVGDIKAAIIVGAANFVTSILWLGLLPLFDIGLAITLALPLTFIFAMGSDYALHLALACRRDDTEQVFKTTGKAVLMSFVTTAGAFAIFINMSDLAVRKTMIGTTLAIGVIFFVTMLAIPLAYPAKRKARRGRIVPVKDRAAREAVQAPVPVAEKK